MTALVPTDEDTRGDGCCDGDANHLQGQNILTVNRRADVRHWTLPGWFSLCDIHPPCQPRAGFTATPSVDGRGRRGQAWQLDDRRTTIHVHVCMASLPSCLPLLPPPSLSPFLLTWSSPHSLPAITAQTRGLFGSTFDTYLPIHTTISATTCL